ncbi:DUF4388 domain-containing protein [Desulforhopalus sp. IMCC35007]|uniref:DUF4388 domain-containing protein n=1 Tax=Desulforhopalus sp. IMCC35007 TaxID=2569543 RepID=UPI0010ADFA1A|nr:DUF4388 domain-containing protein [Desulforhopalus sp. IMCC35007]TKB08417.1 DUF4388 domain-containing protein [Desulforhopalus sp. IMCC35007]
MSQDYIPFPELVDKISSFCSKKETGLLFIATKANRSAQIVIENGKIVFVYFYNKQGQEALDLMLTIKAGRYKFQKNATSPRRSPLPSTEKILDHLSGGRLAAVKVAGGLSSEQKQFLEAALAGYIGPMAAIICEEHLDFVPDMAAAVDALASEIPSEEQAKKFRAQIAATMN